MTFRFLGKQPPTRFIFLNEGSGTERDRAKASVALEIVRQSENAREEHFCGALKEAADVLDDLVYEQSILRPEQSAKNNAKKMIAFHKKYGVHMSMVMQFGMLQRMLRVSAGEE